MRKVIVTGDDFGLSRSVNEAIERAHREGILGAASLMVGAPAADDAVARARAVPSLRVGLHVVVVNGRPVLPPRDIPDLVDRDGAFSKDLVRAGVRFFFHPGIRAQLEAEIRAQFEAFRATGLTLDHVDAQNHMHVHPTILSLLLNVGAEYGMRAMRLPNEPFIASWRSAGGEFRERLGNTLVTGPWVMSMKARLRRAGVVTNDFAFGMNDAGRMTKGRLLKLLPLLPEGVSELFFHPAVGAWDDADPATRGYAWKEELDALTSPDVERALKACGVQRVTFSDLVAARG